MNKIFFAAGILALLASALVVQAGDSDNIFSIYLVRHAEKTAESAEPGNPPLSFCGKLRAGSLAQMLSDTGLEKVYSTAYERTMSTAAPSAALHGLAVDSYDAGDLEGFAQQLLERRQDALVVGHSNTTPVLAGLLAGQEREALDESVYDHLYQVIVTGDQARIILLHQVFYCGS